MDPTVSITNTRENELQFDISIEGTDVSQMRARFVIETDGIDYGFPCLQSDTPGRLTVIIPAMPYLKNQTYDFHIEIITNGYYFDPYKGKVVVTAEPKVSHAGARSIPTPVITPVSVNGTPTNTEEEKPAKETIGDKARDLVDALLNKKAEKKNQSTEPETEKDKVVKEAIRAINIKPMKINTDPLPRPPTKTLRKKDEPLTEEVVEPKGSRLASVIETIGEPKSEQAKKVHDIINSLKQGQ